MKLKFVIAWMLFFSGALHADNQAVYRYNLLEATAYTASSGFTTSTPMYWLWDGSTAEGVNDSKASGDVEAWIEFDFGREEEIAEAKLFQDNGGNRVTHWKVMRWTGESWEDVFPYVQCSGAGWQSKTFEAAAQRIRFYAKCMISGNYVSIHEIELYTKPSAVQRKTVIGCVGDSNTAGSGASDKGLYTWPIQLAGILGNDWQVRNFGESGATLMKSADKPWTGTAHYQRHKDYNANISIIALGTNDSKDKNWNVTSPANFRNDCISLITEFQNYPSKPEVVILMPIKAFPTASYDINNTVINNEIRPIIRDISRTYGVALIDGYATTESLESLMPDKIHLNDAGLGILAEKVASILQAPKPRIVVGGNPSPVTYSEYRWYKNDELIPGAIAASYVAPSPGIYKVAVKLSDTTDDVIVSGNMEVAEPNAHLVISDGTVSGLPVWDAGAAKVRKLPNGLQIENAAGLNLILSSIEGKTVKTAAIRSPYETVDITGLSGGIYIYRLGYVSGKILK
jgi:lysophospholipase L1-like esterase